MRRIITAREQYALRQHWAADVDNFVGTAAGDSGACDPATEDCSGSVSKEKADTADQPRSDAQNNAPTQGSNAEGFYNQRPTPPSGGSSGGSDLSGGAASGSPASSSPVSYSPSEGVSQWHDEVLQGLQRNGLPVTLAPNVEKQMESESSGDPNAINNWDSNAQAGHPSQGLLQTIPSTFEQHHLPGDSMSITDPQANIDSAIGYAKERYGPTLMNEQGQGMGSGHGY